MANPYEYIFFESDQVLTDNDLNKTFSYLDQQNRWTRNKLIGIGIVCGFDIIHKDGGIIEITKGCGVTSQGYLITQGDNDYAYYMPYAAPEQPTNPPLFSYPDNNMPFYKNYVGNKKIFLMLTADEFDGLDTDDQLNAQSLANLSSTFFKDYVIVLFLEATETDLKNCDMFDCNNNGEKVAFIIRPLLVAKKDLPNVTGPRNTTTVTNIPHQIYFKRFNVPYVNLQTSNDILNAFAKLVDDFTLTRVSNAYIYAYEKYQLILNEDDNPFTDLFKQLQIQRDNILKNNIIFIQYFYDFVNDLVNAYYEFVVKVSEIVSACCPDENLFPLHLVLGEASVDTDVYVNDAYRQYFIYSPIFEKSYGEVSEPLFLFQKMKLLVRDFTILSQQTFANALIKITPSQYEHLWLSQRAIPYYYNVNESGSELYKTWSYYKTTHGNATYNLSYNANLYSTNNAVLNPLLYDIEYYNFLRVEGHIGKNYTTVLSDILAKIQNFNLPIDVVAVQAGGDTKTVSENDPQCSFQDLDSMFNVLRSDLYCLLGKLMCYAASQTYTNPFVIFGGTIFDDVLASGIKASDIKDKAAASGVAADADAKNEKVELSENAPKFETVSDASNLNIKDSGITDISNQLTGNFTFDSSLFINLFIYKKGTFLKQQACFSKLATNSVGVFYIQHLPSGSYFFSGFDASNLSNNFLTIVDLIEEIISTLYFVSLSSFNVDTFSAKMAALQSYLLKLNDVFLQYEQGKKLPNFFADFEENIDLFDEIIHSCYSDKFSTLKNEYTARVTRLKQQLLFSNYFNQHRGMEHKAGVPKGGTFIIVYNAPAARTTTTGQTLSADTGFAAFNDSSNIRAKQTSVSDDLKQRLQLSFGDVIAKDPTFIDRFFAAGLAPSFTAAAAAAPVIADNAVIADFYVPYLCCSDCAPVTYILPTETKTVFDIQPRTFLFDDAHNYPFTTNENVTPADFNATTNPGNLNLLTENNKLELHPAMDINSTLKTTLTYKDITLDITIIKPDASFTVNVQTIASGEIMIGLAAKNLDGTSYEWDVNGKTDVFESKAVPTPISLSALQVATDSNNTIDIELTITYTLNDTTSSDSKTGRLTLDIIRKNTNKGPFEPDYVNNDEIKTRVPFERADEIKNKESAVTVKDADTKAAETPKGEIKAKPEDTPGAGTKPNIIEELGKDIKSGISSVLGKDKKTDDPGDETKPDSTKTPPKRKK